MIFINFPSNNENFTRSPGSQSSKDFEATNTSGSDGGRPSSAISDNACEEIDEIDTNNMAIYSGSKKDRSNKYQENSIPQQAEASIPSAGKSLLLPSPSKSIEDQNDQQELDVDLMLNVLNDPSVEDAAAAGTSTNNQLNETPSPVGLVTFLCATKLYQLLY